MILILDFHFYFQFAWRYEVGLGLIEIWRGHSQSSQTDADGDARICAEINGSMWKGPLTLGEALLRRDMKTRDICAAADLGYRQKSPTHSGENLNSSLLRMVKNPGSIQTWLGRDSTQW